MNECPSRWLRPSISTSWSWRGEDSRMNAAAFHCPDTPINRTAGSRATRSCICNDAASSCTRPRPTSRWWSASSRPVCWRRCPSMRTAPARGSTRRDLVSINKLGKNQSPNRFQILPKASAAQFWFILKIYKIRLVSIDVNSRIIVGEYKKSY